MSTARSHITLFILATLFSAGVFVLAFLMVDKVGPLLERVGATFGFRAEEELLEAITLARVDERGAVWRESHSITSSDQVAARQAEGEPCHSARGGCGRH